MTDSKPVNHWLVLAILLFAMFMDILDTTIVNIATPSIQDKLDASYAAIQWITAGYALSFAVALISGGRLGDIFGRKRLFIFGVWGFTLTSLLCGVAANTQDLIIARLLQGLSAAMMIPQIMSSLIVLFPNRRERATASSMFGATAGMAAVLGPIVGALLLEGNPFGLEWRSIFLVNVPVGLLTLAVAWWLVPESKSPHPLRVDWGGTALITAALFLLLFPLIQGRELDWPNWIFWLMGAAGILFILFVLHQRWRNRTGRPPLVVLGLFRYRSFSAGIIALAAFFGGMSSLILLITLYLQLGLGYKPLHAGLVLVPYSIGIPLGITAVGMRLLPKLGRGVLSIGAVIIMLTLVGLALFLHYWPDHATGRTLAPIMLMIGVGVGMVVAPLFNFVLADIDRANAGAGTGVVSTMQQVGTAIGIAVIGTLFFGYLGSHADTSAKAATPELKRQLGDVHLPAAAQSSISSNFETCFTDRAHEKDPTAVPASCQPGQRQPLPSPIATAINQATSSAATTANEDNFTASLVQALWYEVGAFGIAFLLFFLLPRQAPDLDAPVV